MKTVTILLVALLLQGCATFGTGTPRDEVEMNILVENQNWNRATVSLLCRGIKDGQRMRVEFNEKASRAYRNFSCNSTSISVSLFTNAGEWTSDIVPLNPGDNLCVIIKMLLQTSYAYPCRSL